MRLHWITMVAVVLLAVPHGVDAGVRWSGVRNVEMGPGPGGPGWDGIGNVYVDFDQDGFVDVHILFSYSGALQVLPQVGPDGQPNGITTEDRGFGPWCWPLDASLSIGATLPGNTIWDTADQTLIEWMWDGSGTHSLGTWYDTTNTFMGVQFDSADGIHYGWVQMSVYSDFIGVVVHDWAYETVPGRSILTGPPIIHFVSPAGLHVFPYTNWTDAATNIQAAIVAAQYGDIVLVTDGFYTVSSAINLTNGVTVTSVNGRNTVMIDGQKSTRCLYMDHPDAVLRGITVVNGNGMSYQIGGGIYCNQGRVDDCVIRDSEAYYAGGIFCGTGGVIVGSLIVSNNAMGLDWDSGSGGGIMCNGGRVENCVIQDNTAHGDGSLGGGIACASSASLINSTVSGNRAASAGGVACVISSRVDRCVITDNVASASSGVGGGLWVWGGDATSSIIANNTATTGAGAYLGPIEGIGSNIPGMLTATSMLVNCTVAANTALSSAGGIMCASNAVVQNSIIWNNAAPLMANVATGTPATVFLYSCTTPLVTGIGNITNDPQFTPGSYRLKATSPCIDAGTNSNAPPTDIDGEARWNDPRHTNVVSIVDIGADEFVDADLDNMADCWETNYFGSITNRNGMDDADNDGLSNLGEYENSTNPTNSDTDADQMPDGWEVSHSLNPLVDDANNDPDSDGMSNLGEYISSTDPHDADSVLSIVGIRPQFGGIRLDWKGGHEAWQILQYRENIASATEQWTAIFALPPPTALTNAVIDMGATNRTLFYRIRAER
jgi:hypothetical protein